MAYARQNRFNPLFWGQCLHRVQLPPIYEFGACFNPLFWGQCLHQ